MTPTRISSMALVSVVAISALLTGCSSSSGSAESTSAAASAPAASTPASAAAPAASGAPSAELTSWAGQVCTQMGELKTSVTDIGGAVATGGSDVGASLTAQFDVIKASAATLVATVQAVPADAGSGPDAQALKESAAKTQSSIDALGASVSDVQSASGVGKVTALAGVGSAAKDAGDAISATVETVGTALQDGKGTLGQAFAANPSCAALKQ
jgi:hypothetical protein